MRPRLAILIPTIDSEDRRALLARLMAVLQPQVDAMNGKVVVTTLPTASEQSGGPTTGQKRQVLIEKMDADYQAFVDDDDLVSEDYCIRILEALESDPDVVGFRLRHFIDGVQTGWTVHSVASGGWGQRVGQDGLMEYYRTPNHLNPVRRKLALQIGYPNRTIGEDGDYSTRLFEKFPNMREVFINAFLYDYFYRSKK
jgi:hypothetical protein